MWKSRQDESRGTNNLGFAPQDQTVATDSSYFWEVGEEIFRVPLALPTEMKGGLGASQSPSGGWNARVLCLYLLQAPTLEPDWGISNQGC